MIRTFLLGVLAFVALLICLPLSPVLLLLCTPPLIITTMRLCRLQQRRHLSLTLLLS